MNILAIDPSIEPKDCGYAWLELQENGPAAGRLMAYGTFADVIKKRKVPPVISGHRHQALHSTAATLMLTVQPDKVIVDWPDMISFARYTRRSRNFSKGCNLDGLAVNHQAIGAIMAGLGMHEGKVTHWCSAKMKTKKEIMAAHVTHTYRLPAGLPLHVTDAVYMAWWLAEQIRLGIYAVSDA